MFKPIEQKKVETSLAVSEYFATFVELKDKHYIFDFAFNIDRQEIKSKKLSKLKIKIYRKNYQENVRKNSTLDTNFLTKNLKAFEQAKTKDDFFILEETINLEELNAKYVDNRRILREVRPPNFDTQLQNYRSAIPNFFTLKDRNLSIIKKLKIDPSEVILTEEYRKDSNVNELFNHYLILSANSLSKDNKYYHGIESNSLKNKLYAIHQIKIPTKFGLEPLEVIFELYATDVNSLVFEERKKTILIEDLVSIRNSIIQKPIIVETSEGAGRTGFQIAQNDQKAKGLKVQKKIINVHNQVSNYTSIFQIENSKKNDNTRISETNSISEIQIYRCTAYSSDPKTKLSSAFKNIILGTIPFVDQTTMRTVDNQAEKAVEIIIQNVPPEALEFQIRKRNLLSDSFGSFEDYQPVEKFLRTRPQPQRVFDFNVVHDHRYEYSVRYKLNDGTIRDSVFKVHKYTDSSRYVSIPTTISNISTELTSEGSVISFDITSTLLEENITVLQKSIFASQGNLGSLFEKEFEKLKDKFQNIVFYKVTRIDMSVSPAIEEEFRDILVSGPFRDSPETRKNSGISDINPNHDYIYEVRAYYKNPVSLLRDYVVTVPAQIKVGDGKKTKSYKYKPYKWLQQKTLDTGTLLAENADGSLVQSSIVEDSDLGVVATTQVDKLEKLLEIKSTTAKRIDMKTISINWKVASSIENYDHFVVVRECNNKRKILTTTQNLRYVDSLNFNDVGTIIYYVTPVYNDYVVGPTIRTNTIIVNPEEFDGSIK